MYLCSYWHLFCLLGQQDPDVESNSSGYSAEGSNNFQPPDEEDYLCQIIESSQEPQEQVMVI